MHKENVWSRKKQESHENGKEGEWKQFKYLQVLCVRINATLNAGKNSHTNKEN